MKPIFSKKAFFLLAILFLAARIISMCLSSVADPSEARYAAIGRNMAETGNFLVPEFVHEGVRQPFEGKPPLFFQMSGIACKIFGTTEFAVRLPALLSAILILAIVFYATRRLRDESTAILATILCMFTGVFAVFSGLCMTDLLLAAAVTGAIYSYSLFASEQPGRTKSLFSICFFGFLGIGMIVKGPVALVMAGMPVFCFVLIGNRWKELRYHSWFWGTVVFLAIAAPWYYLMTQKQPDFLEYFFINENFKRFLFKEYGDRYGQGRESFRGMALIWTILCTLPFNLFAIAPALQKKNWPRFFSWGLLKTPLLGLSILTIITNTAFWCLTSRVLITYLFPVMPAAAIYLACLFQDTQCLENPRFTRLLKRTTYIFAIVLAAGFISASFLGDTFKDELPGNFFKQLRAPEILQGRQLYFLRHTPYSAEFYFGRNAVQNHPSESIADSWKNSRDAILVFSDYYEEDVAPLLQQAPRKLLLKYKKWSAYAPVDSPNTP